MISIKIRNDTAPINATLEYVKTRAVMVIALQIKPTTLDDARLPENTNKSKNGRHATQNRPNASGLKNVELTLS